ncbi:hypothetical protein CT0861_01961 [Colletotrichum tofieldiae]|uniref:Uncharacterized protein n=1 Tax=Colletotrichum tofieldiae TaxID=708197 RepID=A0A166SMP6_9PEZI|nr:hypothetical protein CT0861_01961 [Colletotrichum tofieldiae]
MPPVVETQGSLSGHDAALQEKRKAAKREKKKKREMRRRKKSAKGVDAEPATPPDSNPETKQEPPERSADADATMDFDSESEWEGFSDPPVPYAHMAASDSDADTLDSKDADDVKSPASEGKNGINALQESIAHQFPGDPRPATHALADLLLDPKITEELGSLVAPSQPGSHTVDQLAIMTRLWFQRYRGKHVLLGIVPKNGDPIVDACSDHRKTGVLWIKSSGGNPSQPGQKPIKFSGMQFVPAEVREYEKKSTRRQKTTSIEM